MRIRSTLVRLPMMSGGAGLLLLTLGGCGALASLMPGSAGPPTAAESAPEASAQSTTQSSSSSYSRTSTVEEINGVPVNAHDRGRDAAPAQQNRGRGFGETCTEMDDCDSRLCFIGRQGNVGFCTRTCDSWSDCPSHWECQRPSNAPHRVCMQDRDDD